MSFELRLKTGFFETKVYDFLIRKGQLILSPKELEGRLIVIPENSILEITLKKDRKFFELEIQTEEKTYQGLLEGKTDYEKLINQMKKNVNKKILCEYEGGH